MSDVLLICLPYTGEMKAPPLGLAYIAAVLERAGYSVSLCDMNPLKLNVEDIGAVIKEHSPKVIGVSSMTPQIYTAHRVAQVAKSVDPSIYIIVGGPHASALPKETLNDYKAFDFAAVGEGEMLMVELVGTLLNSSSSFQHIDGLAYRENGAVVVNRLRTPYMDLDSLPFPSWHLLPMDKYSVQGYGGKINERTQVILTSRACPYQCIFCDSHSIFGRTFRSRSPENVIEEMEFLYRTYGIRQIDFADDMITTHREWLEIFCQAMIERKIPKKIRWMANARVNTVDPELLKLMKEAGCVRLDFGVESGDPRVLAAIKKNITVEQTIRAHRWAKEAGVTVGTFLMVGLPEEDHESAKQTVALAYMIKSDFPSVNIAIPFPGTELYQIAKKKGWLMISDWSKFDPKPIHDRHYKPVMRTEHMTQEDILEAYYYVSSHLMRSNLQSRYGKWFFLNPIFYRDKRIFKYKGIDDALHRMIVAIKMLRKFV
jgi:radical SAM superfamily enzyme YgiQ (UPF0313 family)